jgi:hypothetical protein
MLRLPASFVLIVLLAGASGCGRTVTVEKASAPPASTAPVAVATGTLGVHAAHTLNNPAQKPDPHTTLSCSEAPRGHACVSGTTAPGNPNQFRQRNCDTNIVANSATSCGLAENTFYEYYQVTRNGGSGQTLMVHSSTTGRDYEVFCESTAGLISCSGSPLSTGVYVSFPHAAIAAYTEAQATAYAASHNVGHPGKPASPPPPSKPSPSPSPESGGGDKVGSYSHETDQAFCEEHQCIGDFEGESGYVVECSDGSYSHAGGISGSCSHHGGNA